MYVSAVFEKLLIVEAVIFIAIFIALLFIDWRLYTIKRVARKDKEALKKQ